MSNSKKISMHFGPYSAQIQFEMVKAKQVRFGLAGGEMTTSTRRSPINFGFQFTDSARTFNAYTQCTNQVEQLSEKQPTVRWLGDYIKFIRTANDLFAGAILVRADSITANPDDEPNWNFIIRAPLDGMVNDSTQAVVGLISNNDQTEQINVSGVTGYNTTSPPWTHRDRILTGYEFRFNKELIGAVEVISRGVNKGRVWLKNDLSAEIKLIVANVAEALLSQNELRPQR